MLTVEECNYLLELLAQEVVVAPSDNFAFTITRRIFGYSKDVQRGRLQAKLSILLEVANRVEDKKK